MNLDAWLATAERVKEVGAVEIAAGFARADEQTHKEHPCRWRKSKRPSWPSNAAEDYQGRVMEASPERCELVVRTALPVQQIAAIFRSLIYSTDTCNLSIE
jgi:hypothetical protein